MTQSDKEKKFEKKLNRKWDKVWVAGESYPAGFVFRAVNPLGFHILMDEAEEKARYRKRKKREAGE